MADMMLAVVPVLSHSDSLRKNSQGFLGCNPPVLDYSGSTTRVGQMLHASDAR
eukprot:COSAG01_NODE_56165_length_320_cov_0.773756_2_plen_52_part_01